MLPRFGRGLTLTPGPPAEGGADPPARPGQAEPSPRRLGGVDRVAFEVLLEDAARPSGGACPAPSPAGARAVRDLLEVPLERACPCGATGRRSQDQVWGLRGHLYLWGRFDCLGCGGSSWEAYRLEARRSSGAGRVEAPVRRRARGLLLDLP